MHWNLKKHFICILKRRNENGTCYLYQLGYAFLGLAFVCLVVSKITLKMADLIKFAGNAENDTKKN